MSKPLVLVTAPVSTRSGYGNHARDICRALIESDKYDVKIQSVRWGNTPLNAFEEGNPHHEEIQKRILRQPSLEKQPDLHMHIVVPNEFAVVGKKNIGFTAGIEHTIPPAEWVEGCNRMDLNIFTSEFSKAGFENIKYDKRDQKTNQDLGVLKLEKPSEVLFEGADPEIYKETKELSEKLRNEFSKINNQFCFLFTGHWLQGNMGEDLTGKPELKDPKTGDLVQVDCIPNFFSIHYIFNKEKNVEQLLKNVSSLIQNIKIKH